MEWAGEVRARCRGYGLFWMGFFMRRLRIVQVWYTVYAPERPKDSMQKFVHTTTCIERNRGILAHGRLSC